MKKHMLIAIKEAEKAFKKNEVPIGCVIVKNDKVVSKAFNLKEKTKNVMNHAEILAITKACKKLKKWRLDDCDLYVTMEPCMMCTGAIIQARIRKIYFSIYNEKFGYMSKVKKLNYEVGLCDEQSQMLLKKFFENKR